MTTTRRERLNADTARPMTLHLIWVFVAGGIIFLAIGGGLLLYGMYRSMVLGEPVDWQGFAFMVTAMGGAAGVMLPIFINLHRDRRMQRIEEIRAGQSGAPFPDSPPPHADGGLVNNEALR